MIGENGTVIVGIVNHEYEDVTYKVVILLDNETIGVIDDITLKHEEAWYHNYTFTPTKTGEQMKLEFPSTERILKSPIECSILGLMCIREKKNKFLIFAFSTMLIALLGSVTKFVELANGFNPVSLHFYSFKSD